MSAPGEPIDLDVVNAMDRARFVETFGDIFEHSPWVAEAAWDKLPFASVDQLHAAMVGAARAADRKRQLALFNAHPELAGKEAVDGTLTAASTVEQASAGMNALTRDEVERLELLNGEYRARHGFPFIVCVRHYTKRGIYFEIARRLDRDTEGEIAETLVQVGAITRLRLEARVRDPL